MHENKLKISEVKPELLQPNPWNTNFVDPENEERLDNAIDRLGMFKPILVRELDDGTLEILGGQHRAEAAQRKGFDTVPVVNLGKISDNKAKEIGLADNGRYGNDDALMLANLLQSLGTHDDISSFLPYSDGELTSIFDTTSIDIDELDLPDDDEEIVTLPKSKPQTRQLMRFKVPIEDADEVTNQLEMIMKRQGFTESDSLTNAGDALVLILKDYYEKNDGQI